MTGSARSLDGQRWRSSIGAVAFIGVTAIVAGCGDVDDNTVRGATTEQSGHASSTEDASVVNATFVDVSEAIAPSSAQWFVVDLASGSTLDGTSRVLVEVARDEIGCGEAMRPFEAFRIRVDQPVSFELTEVVPGQPPEFWFSEGGSYPSEPAVHARQFRVDCPASTDSVAAELAERRATWERVGPSSYEFTMSYHVFNLLYGDYRIVVTDGVPISVERGDGSSLPSNLATELPDTIDDVFDQLARAVSADRFVATYDAELGYPVAAMVDQMRDAVDDELEIMVTSLTPAAD